ncbi:MAG: hypothetical protein HY299_03225 [Verrucomicrobia bacterium]|nr:hypothetical protein [Verrucomicrobiota bacterium]
MTGEEASLSSLELLLREFPSCGREIAQGIGDLGDSVGAVAGDASLVLPHLEAFKPLMMGAPGKDALFLSGESEGREEKAKTQECFHGKAGVEGAKPKSEKEKREGQPKV